MMPHINTTHKHQQERNAYSMSNDLQHVNKQKEQYEEKREEASVRDVSSDHGSTTEEQRTCLYDRFPFLGADYSGERAVEVSNWALGHHIQDYSDECFGAFVWKIFESKDHTTLVKVQIYFGFLATAWTKVGAPSLEQLNSASNILDRNVHDAGMDKERGAWKKYYIEKLKKREDQREYRLSRMKDRVARGREECKADLKHKQSEAIKQCQAEMRHAVAHLAEDTIGSITSTVSRNVKADLDTALRNIRARLETFVKDQLELRERGP